MTARTSWLRGIACSAALALAMSAGSAQAELAAEWQGAAMQLIKQAKWPGPQRQRALAILHTAMFDAANAAGGNYQAYAYDGPGGPAEVREAAVTQAALTVMQTLIPERAEVLQQIADSHLDAAASPEILGQGIALGRAAAEAVLQARLEDGADFSADFTPAKAAPGIYQPTSERAMAAPRIRHMTPFVLSSADHFPVPPPPALDSMQFHRDLAEVARLGGAAQEASEEVTTIAKLHAGSGSGAWNQIALGGSARCGLDLLEEARLLALLNLALTDALVAGFNAKYEYAFWRPETAMAALGKGFEHPELAPGTPWSSRIPAPMHPEYPCQHCTSGSAAQEVMESVFGDGEFSFTFTNGKGLERDYTSFRQFAEEEAESRVLAGVHYRRSNTVGDMLGHQIGTYIVQNALQPQNGAGTAECTPGELSNVSSKLSY
ncbi:vanadium-dependent haloperoxidase [Cribrihabitans neustonicus]|uniref:vanadium-dependent haloperoxidase n=1 Tax=Cribrihabitans neustonicus TaxID=1429085 RepID=UPI003B59BA4E